MFKSILAAVPALALVFASVAEAREQPQIMCYKADKQTVGEALYRVRGEVPLYTADTLHGERTFYVNKRTGNFTDVLRPFADPAWACPVGQGGWRTMHYPEIMQSQPFKEAYGNRP